MNTAYGEENNLVHMRRRLHSFAECGFDLPKTTDFVKKKLQSMGYEPQDLGRSGVVCELAVKKERPFVLLRADMDALPIREETRLPFRAENGHMHACGHDMHTAMLLGAAALLKKREETLPSPVRLVFQAAEETLSGARDMKNAGVLTNIGAAFMLHAVTAVPIKTGTLLLPPAGVGAPAACFFEMEIRGKSAHIGEGEKGVDALDTAVSFYLEMKAEQKRLGEDFLLSVGVWHAGDAPNIVPAKARLSGSFRSLLPEKVEHFKEWLVWLCARKHGKASGEIRFSGSCPPLKNDAHLLALLEGALPKNGFLTKKMPAQSGNASEDFAVFADCVPAIALAIAAGEKDKGYEHPLHHPEALFDEEALPIGAAVYAHAAMLLGKATFLQTFTK